MTYDYHQRVVKKWFKATNIDSASSTHAFRASGARHATDNLVALSDVAGVARWKRGFVLNHFIHHTPTLAVRVITGFNKKGNNYALRRSFEAPDLLTVGAKKYVFPWTEVALRQGASRGDLGSQWARSRCVQGVAGSYQVRALSGARGSSRA